MLDTVDGPFVRSCVVTPEQRKKGVYVGFDSN